MKKIILIAFKFPPYSLVGANRWTKFCKYLSRLGHSIEVVTVDWALTPSGEKLLKEFDDKKITIHRLPSGSWHNWRYRRYQWRILNLFKMVVFRLLGRTLFFDDEAQRWHKYVIPFVENLIQKNPKAILIATGAPFQANLAAARVKERNPGIRLIQDFRDPWAYDPYKPMSRRHKKIIEKWQQYCIEWADQFVTVSQTLQKEYSATKGIVITNGYDPELVVGRVGERNNPKIVLTHIGNLTNGRDEPLFELLKVLDGDPDLCHKFKICLVGSCGERTALKVMSYRELKKAGAVELIGTLPQSEALAILGRSDYALHLNGKVLPCALSTKVFEYGLMKIPTFALNYGGEIERLVREADLGLSVNLHTDNLEQKLRALSPKEFQFNITAYSFENLAKQYSQLINSM